jgi:hypothetical protein
MNEDAWSALWRIMVADVVPRIARNKVDDLLQMLLAINIASGAMLYDLNKLPVAS